VDVDWASVFTSDTPWVEIVVRGTVVYLSLLLLLRVVLKRQAGAVSLTDLLLIVLIADAAQNAMASDYKSIPDGLILVAVIVFWSFALDWLGYHIPWFNRFVHPPPLPLVQDGVLLRRNLRKELITEEELLTQLREQGVENVRDVKTAFMEGDGRVSVIPREPQEKGKQREKLVR
jgi:uncharacterized membrane protein YcaP (DUF421 family)